MLGLARTKTAHKLQRMRRVRRDIAAVEVDADLVHLVDELDLEQTQQLAGVVALPAATAGDEGLLHGVQLERQDVAVLVAQLGVAEERILELAGERDRRLDNVRQAFAELLLAHLCQK